MFYNSRVTISVRFEVPTPNYTILCVLLSWSCRKLTAPFNNMRTLKFKAQPTNAFFATVNQMFGSSSRLPTTAERAVTKSLSTVQTTKQCSAVVGSWEEPPNIWLTVAKNAFVGWTLNFRVRMLLKGAVSLDWTAEQRGCNDVSVTKL